MTTLAASVASDHDLAAALDLADLTNPTIAAKRRFQD
jgi:hypothetical protein